VSLWLIRLHPTYYVRPFEHLSKTHPCALKIAPNPGVAHVRNALPVQGHDLPPSRWV